MKRQLTFDFADGNYVVQENMTSVFEISGSDLQFDARKFYDGIYKGENRSTNIDFKNINDNDPLKKGKYIFQWLSDIIQAVQDEFHEADEEVDETEIEAISSKTIILYDMAACAGDGLYIDEGSVPGEAFEVSNETADYAVKISGHSMEPTILDRSIALVKRTEKLEDQEIGIFNVDGNSMCKRYTQNGDKVVLSPDNESLEYQRITITPDTHCVIQGKVIQIISPND